MKESNKRRQINLKIKKIYELLCSSDHLHNIINGFNLHISDVYKTENFYIYLYIYTSKLVEAYQFCVESKPIIYV
jgi:hypothetical protein